MRKAKVELTAEAVRKVIEERQPKSMTQLAHGLGYKGSVSSSLTKKFRALFPDIEALLDKTTEAAKAAKPPAKRSGKPKVAGAKGSKYPRDPRNPFRAGSSYGTCYDILASGTDGLRKDELIRLLAAETGKDTTHAAYDAQVLLSAKPNEDGLSNNNSPRHRSCRPGFWIQKENDHVRLMVD